MGGSLNKSVARCYLQCLNDIVLKTPHKPKTDLYKLSIDLFGQLKIKNWSHIADNNNMRPDDEKNNAK